MDMHEEEQTIRGWLREVGLCGLPKDQALSFFRAVWGGGGFSYAEDQVNLPSHYMLISYIQPRGSLGPARGSWVTKALYEIEEVYTYVSKAIQHLDANNPETVPLGLWLDKLGKFMIDEPQSKWAAHCQLQFSVFPTCILVPEPSIEYEVSSLERPLLGVEAFDPGLAHAIDCQQCRAEVERLWTRFFLQDVHGVEQITFGSPTHIALVGLLHRCWPMAEATAAMEANAAYLSTSGIRALLCSMIYGAMALKSWENDNQDELSVSNEGLMVLKTATTGCCASWKQKIKEMTILALEDLVEGQNHVSRMLRECKGTSAGTEFLSRWAKLSNTSSRPFAEPVIARILNMKEHLVIGPGANSPCYNEGDKLETVLVNSIIANALAGKVRPGVIYDQDMSAFIGFMIEEMLNGWNVWLPGRWLDLNEESPFLWAWARWKGSSSKGGFIHPNTGFLRVESLESLLRTHKLSYSADEIVKANTVRTLEMTDVTDIAFLQSEQSNGYCPLCISERSEPVGLVLCASGEPFPCARGATEAKCQSAMLLEVHSTDSTAKLIAMGIREGETSDHAWKLCLKCGKRYHSLRVRAVSRLGVPGRGPREEWVIIPVSEISERDFSKPLTII